MLEERDPSDDSVISEIQIKVVFDGWGPSVRSTNYEWVRARRL